MRDIDPALQTHLDSETTTTCHCWIVRRGDGTALGFTDHDNDLVVENISCVAASGFQTTEAASELGLSADNQDVEGVLSSDAITEDDIALGRYDDARVEIWLVNWAAPEQRSRLRTSILGEITREDDLFRAELRGLSSLLEQRTGRTYSRKCDAVLGDEKCRVNLDQPAVKTSGVVTKVIGRLLIECTNVGGFEKDWFAGGVVTFTSGRNQGASVEVSASAGSASDELFLWKAAPLPISPGDAFELTAGCDKNFLTCKSKFANQLNFRGCPHIPGSDFALSYARSGAVHDGSPLIK